METTPKTCKPLNCYHLYLKVIRLSNIMSANIRYIILLVTPLLIGLVLFFGQNKDTHHPQIGSFGTIIWHFWKQMVALQPQ